jgi:hypothetical protein
VVGSPGSTRWSSLREVMLLLSPWPESLLAFEAAWAQLAEDTHVVAIDLPGDDAADDYAALVTSWRTGGYATPGSTV